MTMKSSSRFDRINKLDSITCIGKFYHLFAPWNTTWHSFYPIDPRARAKMADIVNKVYSVDAIKKGRD